VLPAKVQQDDCVLIDQPQPGIKNSSSSRVEESNQTSGRDNSRSRAAATAIGTDAQQSSHGVAAPAGSSSGNDTSSPSSGSSIVLSDLQELAVIGSGSSGVVKKVLHRPTQLVSLLTDAQHTRLTSWLQLWGV
jgi:hypothetical protein